MARRQVVLLLWCGLVGCAVSWQEVFDQQMYQDVVDEELFIDASAKIPTGIALGNINDFGDYYQCLSIEGTVQEMVVQGKYCAILVPLQQEPIDWSKVPDWNITWPQIPGLNNTGPNITMTEIKPKLHSNKWTQKLANYDEDVQSRIFPGLVQIQHGSFLGVCVPKVCTPHQALTHWQQAIPFLNINFQDFYCRLPGDKPFFAIDHVAIIFITFLLLITAISTTYDLMQKFYWKREASEGSDLFRCFSVYTNTGRLLNFSSNSRALDCIDGVRSIALLWIIVVHTFSFTILGYIHNQKNLVKWMSHYPIVLVYSASVSVDTFFFLSGLLLVYTTIGKVPKKIFLTSLHLFYLNRFLRLFPLLAMGVLLSASLVNHMADGPFWLNVAQNAQNCREYWWSTVFHIQNYVNPLRTCMAQTWYLSVDTQLYIVSPLVLWWLWGQPQRAWAALTAVTLLSLVCTTVISYVNNFSAAIEDINRLSEYNNYLMKYYVNTFARAPPFFIGMFFGYILILSKDKKIKISKRNASLLWVGSLFILAFCITAIYPVLQEDHTAQWFDNFLNSYMRAIWAAALGWIIFACAEGYGGPVNWFLSLSMWKLTARLSYGLYLVHVPIMLIANGTWVKTHYVTSGELLYRFAADFVFSVIAAFTLCVLVDAPCITLQKLLIQQLGGKPPQRTKKTESTANIVEDGEATVKTSL
ncbi:nose resistant to fluoxetine protein 6-like [Pectinophora gossypiella]|uniref:nose resistant to fluoxetine protein 6-like n=1 Tax=Pectinophora gossypiella TaxID=13191 RepID=UPI00214E32BD|nr:nose resistant to fluoxetine protein 6-like [Pectinophora gossypiella]